MATGIGMDAALEIADRVERFVREEIIPYESDPRRDDHGAPLDEMVMEMREKARACLIPDRSARWKAPWPRSRCPRR